MRKCRGFTLIELMIVVAIIGVLAAMATPAVMDRVIRVQVGEGLEVAGFAREAVAAYWRKHRRMPADNAAAGLPPAGEIVGTHVTSLQVRDGHIVITYGNQSNRHIVGKTLALRPAVVAAHPVVPIAWVCGRGSVPDKMSVRGESDTTIPTLFLPIDCRPGP